MGKGPASFQEESRWGAYGLIESVGRNGGKDQEEAETSGIKGRQETVLISGKIRQIYSATLKAGRGAVARALVPQ